MREHCVFFPRNSEGLVLALDITSRYRGGQWDEGTRDGGRNEMRMTHKKLWLSLMVLMAAAAGCASRDRSLELGPGPAANGTATGSETALPKCPVMDEPIDSAVSIKTEEGPVYFCCKGCINKYKANPAKYAEQVALQRRALADQR